MMIDRQSDAVTATTRETIDRFNDAFSRHDVDAIMACMTVDCVFESTDPPPDGRRYEGQAAVRQVWNELFAAAPQADFTEEEMFAAGDRCVVRWTFRWTDAAGQPGHVRGVDIMRVRDGRVAEKFSYVKG